MCTFVPNGNKPIKKDAESKPPTQDKDTQSLNPFPGWKKHNDEFVVDL